MGGGSGAIGVDVGGTYLKAGIVGEDGEVRHRLRVPIDGSEAERVFDAVGSAVRECEAAGHCAMPVGVGLPGILDQSAGVIRNSPNLHCLDGRNLNDLMRRATSRPFTLDNDANCAAFGEYMAGAGKADGRRRPDSFVLLTIGTGVGGGIVLGGHLWRGHRGYAGEPGHIVIDRAGLPCKCGGRGCLETLVSAGAIVDAYAARGREAESSEIVACRAAAGEAPAREALAEVGRNLGIGIAAILNLLNPETVAVGGGVMGAGELLLGPAREEASRRAFHDTFASAQIVPARLGNEAGLIGAGLMALQACS